MSPSPKAALEAWLINLIKIGVTAALTEFESESAADLQGMENRLTAAITSLPGLLGSQIQNTIGSLLEPITAGITQITGLINRLPFGGKG